MPLRARKQCHLGIFLWLISSFNATAFCSFGFRNGAALEKSQQNPVEKALLVFVLSE